MSSDEFNLLLEDEAGFAAVMERTNDTRRPYGECDLSKLPKKPE